MGRASLFLQFAHCRRGNFALLAALLAPVLLGLVGGGIDLLVYQNHSSELQQTADAAVLAAAAEAGLKGWSAESAKEIATSVVKSNLTNKFSGVTFAEKIEVDEQARRIKIELTQDHYGYFFIGYFTGSPQIVVRASARATGQATICIIVQSPDRPDALAVSGNSYVHASGCSAYSNSVSAKGMVVMDASRLTTQLACSAGGYSGRPGSFSPPPITDCPSLADPLLVRAAVVDRLVSTAACDFKKTTIKGGKKTLMPGRYCGGLEITDGAVVELQPGIYIISAGNMRVDKKASLSGSGVGLVFAGDPTKLEFKNDSTVSLSAPEQGPMAGILMYAQVPKKERDFRIESRDAQKLIGTVYLPGDQLVIGGDKDADGVCDPDVADDGTITPAAPGEQCISDVGAASSWTAIIAKKLKITAGSTLVLNSDYSSSDVPVPDGIGPNSSRVVLTN